MSSSQLELDLVAESRTPMDPLVNSSEANSKSRRYLIIVSGSPGRYMALVC
jgi:hypothetical protein